jgi:hypothetical protein
MRAALRSFAGQTKAKKFFVRIRMSIDPKILIWMTRSTFLCELGQLHNLHRARGLKAQIIGHKEITPRRHSSMPVHGVYLLQATLCCQHGV